MPEPASDPGWETAEAKAVASAFDPRNLPASFYQNPYPTYQALLEHDPVHRCPDGSWFLTRHADLHRIYRDTATFSSDKKIEFKPKFGDTPLFEHHTTSLVFNDPPLHTRVRKRIVGALSPRAIAHMESGLIALVEDLLDTIGEKGDADLIDDFASAIPIEIIGNLLGVPHAERGPLRGWSLAILGALEPVLTPQQEQRGNDAVTDFVAYLKGLVADRRARPGDPSTDVLTRLIDDEGKAGNLSEAELLQNCIFILNAGHETTTNLIGNGLYALMTFPDQRRRLIDSPQLIDTAVEEFLRFESSNQLGNRRTLTETTFGNETLPAGSLITLCIGAANRDPAQFPDPDRLDIARTPNKHLAFAGGPHLCAGLSLARLEGRVAISRFLERFPDYGLIGEPVRGGRVRFRGFQSLPVRVK
ncbi:MAG: cytochrome P450 [Rhizobiales bacterium]|nr:cytochrome P450 [Hyphomicrobiales bacterium]